MSITFVQSSFDSTSGSGGLIFNYSSPTANGNLLVVVIGAIGSSAPDYSVVDNGGSGSNVYMSAQRVTLGSAALEMFYCIGASSVSGVIITPSTSTSIIGVVLAEYNPSTGVITRFDSANSTTGTGSVSSFTCPGPSYATVLDELEVTAAVANAIGGGIDIQSPFSERQGAGISFSMSYGDYTSPSSTAAVYNSSGTVSAWLALTGAFYTIAPTAPTSRQASQQLYHDLPSFWQEWEAYKQSPFIQNFIPPLPRLVQPSQRIEPLPDYTVTSFEQSRRWPVATAYAPTPPTIRQANQQLSFALPDYWQEWEAYRSPLWVAWFVPPSPPLAPRGQRVDPQANYESLWYEQERDWPIPVQFVPAPTPPASRQPNQQLYFDLPDYTATWWETAQLYPLRIVPLPSSFLISEEGVSGVYNAFTGISQLGIYRVQNNIAGFNVYVGINQVPGFSSDRTFSATLPISVPITLPPSGNATFYVVVRAQDVYGLESQNQQYQTITLTSTGSVVLPPLSSPQGLLLVPLAGGQVRVQAIYPTALTDSSPADTWQIWASTLPPDTFTTPPTASAAVTGQMLTLTIPALLAGTYYFAVGLYRSADEAVSGTMVGSVVVVASPNELTAVPSGYEVLP